jgi:hypothetical protein
MATLIARIGARATSPSQSCRVTALATETPAPSATLTSSAGRAAGGDEVGARDRLGEVEVELPRLGRADVDAHQLEGAGEQDDHIERQVVVDQDQVGHRLEAKRAAHELEREGGEARRQLGVEHGDADPQQQQAEVARAQREAQLGAHVGAEDAAHASILRTATTPTATTIA